MSQASVKDLKNQRAAKVRGCPFHTQKVAAVMSSWWPNQLNLKPLGKTDPIMGQGETGNYADAFATLDLAAVKADIFELMTTSQDWW